MTHQLCIIRHEGAGQLEPFADSFSHEVGLTSERQIAGVQAAKGRRLREEFVYSLLDHVRCNRAGVSSDSAGIPSEDRLTAEDKHGLTKLFWGISAGPSNARSGHAGP